MRFMLVLATLHPHLDAWLALIPFIGCLATAVVDGEIKEVSLSDYAGKFVVLFFYPKVGGCCILFLLALQVASCAHAL